ncbi:MAG: VanW family protein [Oscillospiraceae bacterium]|nr:VanW family protein [Oscillospiraceae bacterium]
MKKKTQYKKRPTKAFLIGGIVLAALVAIGSATYYFANGGKLPGPTPSDKAAASLNKMKVVLDVGTIYNGIFIDGQDVSGKTKQEALSLFEGGSLTNSPQLNIVLSVSDVEYPLKTAGLVLESNVAETVEQAYQYGRTATGTSEEAIIQERYQQVMDLATSPKYFQTSYTLSEETVSELVHEVLDPLNTEMIEPVVEGFDVEKLAFIIGDSQEGITLGIEDAIRRVKEALDNGEYTKTVAVGASIVQPSATKEFLESYLGLVSSTKTGTTNVTNRNTNIRLVCEIIDGMVLQPGEYFDYNEHVGERTAARGFKEAGGIYDGTLRQELGGGICQVSGTMYHSVVKADLQVDTRFPHSWPSDYVPTGTDATVTWGGPTFKFTNNSEYPVAIHAKYEPKDNGNGGWCTVEIYGRPIPDGMTIEFIGVVYSSSASTEIEYVANPAMPIGETDSVRGAHSAISAGAYQVFYKGEEEIKRVKVSSSYYPMIKQKIEVGVLDPDGVTVHTIDPLTGVVIINPTDPSDTSSSDLTEPPVTEPPVTEPPVTEPPVTDPPVTEPPVTEPPVTDPPVTEPPPG